jgi:hypothetical protein
MNIGNEHLSTAIFGGSFPILVFQVHEFRPWRGADDHGLEQDGI